MSNRGLAVRCFCALVFLIGSWMAFSGGFDDPLEWVQFNPLGNRAEVYLDASLQKATAGFLVVSAVKAGLAVLEGSEVGASIGVGVTIQAGDLVQSVYDYVDVAWRTLFLAAITLLALKVALTASLHFAAITLGLALFVAAIAVVGPRQRWLGRFQDRTVDFLRILTVSVVVLVFVIPAAVIGASQLSAVITAPLLEDAEAGMQDVHEVLAPVREPKGGFFQTLRNARETLTSIVDQLSVRSGSLFRSTLALIVGYLFDCLVFPLGLVLLGVRMARWAVGYALAESRLKRVLALQQPHALGPGRAS